MILTCRSLCITPWGAKGHQERAGAHARRHAPRDVEKEEIPFNIRSIME